MKRTGRIILCAALLTSCQRQREGHPDPEVRDGAVRNQRAVHAIELPRYQIDLPEAPGRDTFAVACISCHSARYIATQPPFSQAKWDEEVRKMMKNYGAVIAEDQVPIIVRYLMTTKESGN